VTNNSIGKMQIRSAPLVAFRLVARRTVRGPIAPQNGPPAPLVSDFFRESFISYLLVGWLFFTTRESQTIREDERREGRKRVV